MSTQTRRLYEFGPFRLDPSEHLLLRDGKPVLLTPKAFETLVVLVERSGHLVEKDDLMKKVWPDAFVEEVGLARNISALRKALGEGPDEHQYIETIPKRGYRFVARVRELSDENADLLVERHIRAQIIAEEEIISKEEPGQAGSGNEATATSHSGIAAPEKDSAADLTSGGENQVSRIKRHRRLAPAALLLIAAAAVITYSRFTGAKKIDSIAVLPFVNASADPNTEYLSDGITESTINSLSQLSGLRVVPRTTVFRYKGQQVDPQKVGRDLGVRAVLTGRVIKLDDTFHIQTELVDIANDSQLWGERYDWKPSDIIAGQQEIATRISEKLRLRLTGEEQKRLTRRYTENADAYQAYLKGRYHWNQRTEAGLKKAVEYFRQAIEIDPTYAAAYSGLADSLTGLGYSSYLAPKDAFPQAKAAEVKALEIDPMLAESHTSLAYAKLYYDWGWPGAEREFKRAIEINPNYATAHHWYSVYLTAMGRPDDASREIRRAQELDPFSLIINTDMGFELYYSGQYEQAIKQLRAALEMKQDFPLAHLWLGRAYQEKGMYAQAVEEFKKVETVIHGWPVTIAAIGYVDGVSGNKGEARKVLDELSELSKQEYVTPYGVALVYAGLGEKEQALHWLEKAYQDRANWLVWLKLDPRWSSLRSDPRYADLVRRVGLDER